MTDSPRISFTNLTRLGGSNSQFGSQGLEPSKASQEKVLDTSRITDKGWEVVQTKTFTNWINHKLHIKKYSPVENLATAFNTGEKLIELLEIIGDESLGKYKKSPALRLQKIENVNLALSYIKKRGVPLTNIGAEDIVDGNTKLVLGMVWSIILRFTIADISQEGLTAKEGLLLWCQRKTANYAPEVQVKDFHLSWKDGLAFCALIHRHRPDLLKYHELDKNIAKRNENTALAFDVAETHLGIPKLIDVEDITESAKPDERSVMTYVAQYFHAFSALEKVETAGRRVNQFAQVTQAAWELENDYERRVHKLMTEIADTQAEWAASRYESYRDAKKGLIDFEQYKATMKRTWVAEKRELDTLLGNIQTKLSTYNLKPYNPPAGLTLADLDACWTGLVAVEAERKRIISNYIRDIKEYLRKKYAEACNNFQSDLNQIAIALANLDGELEAQQQKLAELQEKLNAIFVQIEEIESANSQCEEAAIEDNEYTIYSVEDLKFEYDLLKQSLVKKGAFIENQMVARKVTSISPQQLEAYSKTFRHFDKDNSNALGKLEFKAALQAEGTQYPEEEFEKVFARIAIDDAISFESWINFVRSVEEDRTSPDQLKSSFATIAAGKDHITEADLYTGQIPPEVVEYLKVALPPKVGVEGGYDYQKYLETVFNEDAQ